MKKVVLAAVAAVVAVTASAQSYRMTTPIAPGVAVPDKVESSIGTLDLSYGYPDEPLSRRSTTTWIVRARCRPICMAIPIVNQAGMRESLRKFGPVNQTNAIWENLVDATHRGADGQRQHDLQLHVARHEQGSAGGRDPAQGARHRRRLLVQAGSPTSASPAPTRARAASTWCCRLASRAKIPSGYHVVRPNTFGNFLFFRSFVVDGSTKPGVDSVKKTFRHSPARRHQSAGDEIRQHVRACQRTSSRRVTTRSGSLLEPGHPGRAGGRDRPDHHGPVSPRSASSRASHSLPTSA